MSKSRENRTVVPKPASAVPAEMLAQYRRAARASRERNVTALRRLVDEYELLVKAGDGARAFGVGLELIDVALRIATTPSPTQSDWEYKKGSFEQYFKKMMRSLGHAHVARIADAVIAAEQALKTRTAGSRH